MSSEHLFSTIHTNLKISNYAYQANNLFRELESLQRKIDDTNLTTPKFATEVRRLINVSHRLHADANHLDYNIRNARFRNSCAGAEREMQKRIYLLTNETNFVKNQFNNYVAFENNPPEASSIFSSPSHCGSSPDVQRNRWQLNRRNDSFDFQGSQGSSWGSQSSTNSNYPNRWSQTSSTSGGSGFGNFGFGSTNSNQSTQSRYNSVAAPGSNPSRGYFKNVNANSPAGAVRPQPQPQPAFFYRANENAWFHGVR